MAIAYNDKTGQAYTLINNEWIPTPNSDIADSDSGEVFVYDPEIKKWKSVYVPPVDPEEFEEEGGYYGSLDVGLPIKTDYSGEEYKGVLGSLKKYFEQKTQSDILAEQGAARMGSKVIVETAKSPFKLAEFAGTIVAPKYTKEIKDAVANFGPVQAVDNYLNSIGLADLDPEVTPNEKIVSDLIGFMTIGTLGKKSAEKIYDAIKKKWGKSGDDLVEKSIKPSLARRATSVGGFGAGVTHAGVQLEPDENTIANLIIQDKEIADAYKKLRDNPETVDDFTTKLMGFLNGINNKLPESVKEAVRKLEVNPQDSEQEKLIKRYIEETGITTGIGGILLAAKYATLGIARLSNRVTSLVTKDRTANVPTTSKDTEVVSTEVKEVTPKLSEVEEKLVNEEATKRTRAWADKRATERTPDAEVDMEAEKLLYNEKFEEFKLEVIKDLEFMGAIKPVRPTTKVEPEVASTGTATVKRTPDFKETGEYEVTLSNGEVHRIFRDTEQFSSPRWYRVGEDNLAGLGSTRKEAIEALEKRAASKPKVEPEVASTDTATEPKLVIPKIGEPEPQLSQRTKFVETLGKVNNTLAKLFASERGLPKQLYEMVLESENAFKSEEALFLNDIKQLTRSKKKYKVSDQDFENFINKGTTDNLPSEFITKVRDVQTRIQSYNDRLNDLLGLKGKDRIQVIAKGEDVYYTKTYEAAVNPEYYPLFKEFFAKRVDDPDSVVYKKIQNARKLLRRDWGIDDPDEVDSTIQGLVQRVAENHQDKSIVDSILTGKGGTVSPKATAVLRKRDVDLAPEIQELLGVHKDPLGKLETTLVNQARLLSEVELISNIHKYFKTNVGKEIDLGRLIPKFPTIKAKITSQKLGNEDQSFWEHIMKDKEGLTTRFSKEKLLEEFFTSKALADNIRFAFDLNAPAASGFSKVLRTTAALGQAKETILDFPAYVLNTMGMIQNLAANGTLLSTRAYPEAVKSIAKFGLAVTKRSNQAVNEFALLKRLGIIDQDATGELISQLANVYKGNTKNLYKRVMKTLGKAYGTPDTIGKLIAYNVRKANLEKANPRKYYKGNIDYDEFIIRKAAEFVTDTMATYQRAPAAAIKFARTPLFGNYILFTTELARTTKGMFKHTGLDLKEAMKKVFTGQPGGRAHLSMAMKQAAGLGAVFGGYALYANRNNSSLKTEPAPYNNNEGTPLPINKYHKQFLNMTAAPWAKGSSPIFLEPFVRDDTRKNKEDRYTRTRVVHSNSADMWDAGKGPGRLLLGKMFGGDFAAGISPDVLDNAFKVSFQTIAGQFASPKFFVQSIINLLSGVDENGRPIFDKIPGETLADKTIIVGKQLGKGLLAGGTYKAWKDYVESSNSEELLEEGRGLRASGYPLNMNDITSYVATGTRPQTINVNKAMGFHIYNDMKEVGKSAAAFNKFLGSEIVFKPNRTNEDVQEIINKYRDLQERKLGLMKKITKNLNVFKNVQYVHKFYDKNGKIKEEVKRFKVGDILKSATDNFTRQIDKNLILPLTTEIKKSVKRGGVFRPDMPFSSAYAIKLSPLLRSKGFTKEQTKEINKGLAKSYSEFAKKPLYLVEEEESK
jgi:predicted Zn-dependent protease with MMP-like domain